MEEPEARIVQRLRDLGDVIVAFSGGVDSGLLSDLATEALGDRSLIATAVSPSLPRWERDAARRVARSRGWWHVEVETDEVSDPNYAKNGTSRCFFCRQHFLAALQPLKQRHDIAHVAMGMLVDDLGDHRPGEQAADQAGVLRPLAEAGLDKAAVRRIAKRRGLELWDKPANACLSSRIPYGTVVRPETLRRIERAEEILHDLGFGVCRVRDHHACARIEVPEEQLVEVIRQRERISSALRDAGYNWVSLDLDGFRSGSMNVVLARASASEPVGGELLGRNLPVVE